MIDLLSSLCLELFIKLYILGSSNELRLIVLLLPGRKSCLEIFKIGPSGLSADKSFVKWMSLSFVPH